jgi:hypothetical protein
MLYKIGGTKAAYCAHKTWLYRKSSMKIELAAITLLLAVSIMSEAKSEGIANPLNPNITVPVPPSLPFAVEQNKSCLANPSACQMINGTVWAYRSGRGGTNAQWVPVTGRYSWCVYNSQLLGWARVDGEGWCDEALRNGRVVKEAADTK